ncbi:hypothetical protein tb265_14490 [Gemmatimonadetes bacterium T265]|nr:hypothetical protein tb265_14490 [Gemmatimonadetes bacterium T265]
MTSPRPRRQMTPEEYLAFERRSRFKHEYVDGVVYAMSGTTRRHGKIVGNVYRRLWPAAKGGPCEVFVQDLKVHVDATKYYYPDVVAVCGPEDDDADVIPDPCLVVEVTSRSTRATDHREKLIAYRKVPTLRAYLIVSHREQVVDRHWRDAAGAWQHEVVTPESGGRVAAPCPETVLTLDAIYEGVTLLPRLRRIKEPPASYTPG